MEMTERRRTQRLPARDNLARIEWAENAEFLGTPARLIDISQEEPASSLVAAAPRPDCLAETGDSDADGVGLGKGRPARWTGGRWLGLLRMLPTRRDRQPDLKWGRSTLAHAFTAPAHPTLGLARQPGPMPRHGSFPRPE